MWSLILWKNDEINQKAFFISFEHGEEYKFEDDLLK